MTDEAAEEVRVLLVPAPLRCLADRLDREWMSENLARWEADFERAGLECPWKQRGDDLDRWLDDGGR